MHKKYLYYNVICYSLMFMKNISGTAAYWADILGNLLATIRCLGPPILFVTLSADDNNWPELKMLLQNITYGEATCNSFADERSTVNVSAF